MSSSTIPISDEEHDALLVNILTGNGQIGVDEQSLVSLIGKLHLPEQRSLLRRSANSDLFKPDGHPLLYPFERWNEDLARQLKFEFACFKKAVVMWAMHPWERDARLAHYVLHKDYPVQILVEISCTRSSEELLGARRAYHALYHRSIEEDVAYRIKGDHSEILVGLVSAYRYEGPKVHEDIARSEAKILGAAIKNSRAKNTAWNEDVVRILSTRSKNQLSATFNHFKEIHGVSIDEDLVDDLFLRDVVQCLNSPPAYFIKVVDDSLKDGADRRRKEGLTRAIVTRANVDIKEIKEEYLKQYGAVLEDAIAKHTRGNYRDALLSILERAE